jgi:hypothetical protein
MLSNGCIDRRLQEFMRKVNMTVGQCLVVLLWLQVLAASEAATLLHANVAFFSGATLSQKACHGLEQTLTAGQLTNAHGLCNP